MKIITRRYFEETGLSAYKHNWYGKRIHNQAYIDWLEKQCVIHDVVKPLKDKEEKCPCEIPFDYRWCEKHQKWN